MSGLGWQDVVVAIIVLGAAGYLVRRKLHARRSASACSACEGCATPTSTSAAPAGETLVSIGVAPRHR